MRPFIKRYFPKDKNNSAWINWRWAVDRHTNGEVNWYGFIVNVAFCWGRLHWTPGVLGIIYPQKRKITLSRHRWRLIGFGDYPYYPKDQAREYGLPHQTTWEAIRSLKAYEAKNEGKVDAHA